MGQSNPSEVILSFIGRSVHDNQLRCAFRSGISQAYDGDGLRAKKTEAGATTYYVRSAVLGGQVMAEISGGGVWQRGYVYAGSSLMAVQQGGVNWVHEDPITKSKRVTDINGNVVSTIELDPWGADTNRSSNQAFQPKRFTSYDRDGNGSDEAMFRRYNRWWSRFDQPDPYDGSYNLTDPQSFNRYAYVQNDPVNFVDPTGLDDDLPLDPWDPWDVLTTDTWAPHSPGGSPGRGMHGPLQDRGDTGEHGGGGPQEPGPTPTPTPCPGSIPEDIARMILRVASQEGIDPTLLSVSMRHESSFGTDMIPRERREGTGRNRRLVGWDVGPMQLATNVWNRSPFTDGLSNPFGGVAMNRHTRQYASFNGNFEENVIVGARAFSMDILSRSRSLADAAGLYRAGSRTGPGYGDRFNEYTREAARDRAQLNCVAGRR